MVTNVGKQLFDILDMANGTVKAADICAMVRMGKIFFIIRQCYIFQYYNNLSVICFLSR